MSKPSKKNYALGTDHGRDHAPSERWQRGSEPEVVELEPGHRVQRVRTGLYQLRDRGRIDDCHVHAALRYRADYELGIEGARDPERTGCGSRSHDGAMISRVDAVSRYRATAEYVGPDADALLLRYVVEGQSIRSISTASGFDTRRLAEGLAESLDDLVNHYTMADARRSGLAGASEPRRVLA